MAGQIHLGHVYHIAGSPNVTEAAAALVSIPVMGTSCLRNTVLRKVTTIPRPSTELFLLAP